MRTKFNILAIILTIFSKTVFLRHVPFSDIALLGAVGFGAVAVVEILLSMTRSFSIFHRQPISRITPYRGETIFIHSDAPLEKHYLLTILKVLVVGFFITANFNLLPPYLETAPTVIADLLLFLILVTTFDLLLYLIDYARHLVQWARASRA